MEGELEGVAGGYFSRGHFFWIKKLITWQAVHILEKWVRVTQIFRVFLFDVLFSLNIFSFILYSDFCQILIDFHGQITGNDDPNKFQAEITQNNREITVNCLWKSIIIWQKSKHKMKEKISRNKMYSLFLFCQKRIIKQLPG